MTAALLLDRDGVINADRNYVHRVEDFVWQPGIFDLTRAAVARSMAVVVVTNQSGIGRGYYTEEDFQAVTAHMRRGFEAEGVPIAAVYHCPFHPDALVERFFAADHPWRKPRPGMILAARDDLGLDLGRSVLIGDRWSDIEAGATAGVGTLVIVGPRGKDHERRSIKPDTICSTVADAARWFEDWCAAALD